MRLEYLKQLKAIAASNSITAAANQLFMTQQALSKSIKAFETELGVKLLVRTNKGVKLTSDGEYIVKKAEQIIPLLNDIDDHFAAPVRSKIDGRLKLMLIPSIRDYILRRTISRFYKNYPKIDFQMTLGDEKEIIPALLQNEIDLGFFAIVTANNRCMTDIPAELQFVPINKYRYQAILPISSPLAKLSEVAVSQLLAYPIILFPPSELEEFNPYKILSYYGEPNIRLVDSYDLYDQFLSDELGVSISVDLEPFNSPLYYHDANQAAKVVYRPISDNLYGNMGYIYNKKNDNPCARYFLEEFAKQY